MRLLYTRRALADLAGILDYIRERSPQGARRVQARIRSVIRLALRHPRIGLQTDRPRIRRLTTTPYPYLVFYEARDDAIIVHGIRHTARAPSSQP